MTIETRQPTPGQLMRNGLKQMGSGIIKTGSSQLVGTMLGAGAGISGAMTIDRLMGGNGKGGCALSTVAAIGGGFAGYTAGNSMGTLSFMADLARNPNSGYEMPTNGDLVGSYLGQGATVLLAPKLINQSNNKLVTSLGAGAIYTAFNPVTIHGARMVLRGAKQSLFGVN